MRKQYYSKTEKVKGKTRILKISFKKQFLFQTFLFLLFELKVVSPLSILLLY